MFFMPAYKASDEALDKMLKATEHYRRTDDFSENDSATLYCALQY